jgi:hypothetical protein
VTGWLDFEHPAPPSCAAPSSLWTRRAGNCTPHEPGARHARHLAPSVPDRHGRLGSRPSALPWVRYRSGRQRRFGERSFWVRYVGNFQGCGWPGHRGSCQTVWVSWAVIQTEVSATAIPPLPAGGPRRSTTVFVCGRKRCDLTVDRSRWCASEPSSRSRLGGRGVVAVVLAEVKTRRGGE